MNRVKDTPTLLRALAALARLGVDFRLDLVGEDTLHGEMHRLADALGLGTRVCFLGFKTQRGLRAIVESADLLVMSSLHEAGPLVLLEAAVAGVPAVGTAVGHFVEWAPTAALAVPVADPAALAAAIQTLLADEALRLRIARAAQRRAITEDADRTARAFDALCRGVSGAYAKARDRQGCSKFARHPGIAQRCPGSSACAGQQVVAKSLESRVRGNDENMD